MMIATYERKQEIWITGKKNTLYGDMCLPIGDLEIHIKGNELECSDTTGVCLNGKSLSEVCVNIDQGDFLNFSEYTLSFYEKVIVLEGENEVTECHLTPAEPEEAKFDGYPYYKRSPRIIYRISPEKIEIKSPPPKKAFTKGGILQLIIPSLSTALFTVVMGIIMKRGPYVYMSIGMTAITLCFSARNFIVQSREMKQENKEREEIYEIYLLKLRKRIREARAKEKEAIEYQNPTPERIVDMIQHNSSRLYEKSLLDDDFLQVNLGYCTGQSKVEVTFDKDELDMEKDELVETAREIPGEYGAVDGLPVAVDLKKAHLGLVGSSENVHEQIRYLMLQLTFFQSYRELEILFIHKENYREQFAYMRWYPHVKVHSINLTGQICNEQARDQILGSVQQILKERVQKLSEEKQETVFTPYFLFIIDEPKLVLNHAIMEYLQKDGKGIGFSMIYTTDQQANLPENIKTICVLENAQDGKLVLEEGHRREQSFKVVHTNGLPLEQTARRLSAIVHEQGVSSKIPESITFFDMYHIEHPEELQVSERWKSHESHKSLAVPLGVRAEEDYVELNLHEKAHGPHGLVAGTTGSGKSEIVQSYILSLAVNFHPHEVGFLLIDYKGGGMANLFEKLPHLLGTITNLDKAESMRAMASIKSELSRRQQIFSDNNVNHINGYNQLFKLGKVSEPLPHLFLISDEFAELKKEQPEFMSELVSAARIGRSLGIHLILATQKPSGVVDDQIWTNSKFKLCLKVQDTGDSREMLKTPDAANITQAGRAYLQVGNNEIYELFQSAWSGAAYGGNQTEEEKEDNRVYLVNELGQGELINKDLSGPIQSNQIKKTQLDVIVEHLAEVYNAEHAVLVKKPWLPSLPCPMQSPHTLQVQDSAKFTRGDYCIGIGMIDVPEEQLQEEYVLDLVKNGHLLYMASSGYGKSMLLTNIILGLAMKNAVHLLNFYILDLGNSALIPLKGLPHVADYMGMDDSEKVDKFKKLILAEIRERKQLLAKAMAQNIYVYNESQPQPLKAIVIALDNYDVIGELGDDMVGFIQKVARDGAGLGIYLLVTMTREGAMRVSTAGNFKERIAGFNFIDGENNSFIGRSQLKLTEDKKGRALVKREQVNVMQLYTPVPFENEIAYNEKLQNLIKQIADASTEPRAKGIPVLPEQLRYEMLPQYPDYEERSGKFPVGIDADNLSVKYLDFTESTVLILGGTGSGKTNTVKTLFKTVKEHPIYIFDGADGVLRNCAETGRVYYANTKETIKEQSGWIKELVEERKENYEEERIDQVSLSIKEFAKSQKPVYVVIDHMQEILNIAEDKAVLDILTDAVKYGIYVLVTADNKLRKIIGCEFSSTLMACSEALILGSIKDQSFVTAVGIREDNKKLDFGYYVKRGNIVKVKLMENE